jgi:hypothetical protein
VWLTDGEMRVGAQIKEDPRERLIGVPAWDTLVYLEEAEDRDPVAILFDLLRITKSPNRSIDDETKILRLLTQFEEAAPPAVRALIPTEGLAKFRAGALMVLGHSELALLEIEEAHQRHPDDPEILFFYLDLLRRTDLERALSEAADRAERPHAPALVLASCINILATHIDRLPDDQIADPAARLLAWIERFETAPGREGVRASVLAQVVFNGGVVFLRLGRVAEAHESFELAHRANPADPNLRQATALDTFDQKARDIANEVRRRPLAA